MTSNSAPSYIHTGRHREALAYAVAGLVPDKDKAGTVLPVARVLLQSIQARALAALGRSSEAGRVFEAAADEAHRYGLLSRGRRSPCPACLCSS